LVLDGGEEGHGERVLTEGLEVLDLLVIRRTGAGAAFTDFGVE